MKSVSNIIDFGKMGALGIEPVRGVDVNDLLGLLALLGLFSLILAFPWSPGTASNLFEDQLCPKKNQARSARHLKSPK